MLLCFQPKAPTKGGTSTGTQVQFDILEQIERAIDSLTDPITGSPSYGELVSGIICLHVDDLFLCWRQGILPPRGVCYQTRTTKLVPKDTHDVLWLVKEYVGRLRITSHLNTLTKKEASKR